MPNRLHGFDENGNAGSVVANELPEGWTTLKAPESSPKKGRPKGSKNKKEVNDNDGTETD